jgi:phage baseplate assembly protein W
MSDKYKGLVIYDKNGAEFSKNEVQLIAENIKRILLTRKGERINEPSFGSNALDYIFMPQMMVDDLIAEICYSIEQNEPRVTVDSCTLSSANQNDVIYITLNVTIGDSDTATIGVEI